MSASTQVKDYEEEVAAVAESIRRDMAALRATIPDPNKPSAESKPVTNRGEKLLGISGGVQRLADTIRALEVAAVEVTGAGREELASRIEGYKGTLSTLEKERDVLKKLSAEADHGDLTRNATSTRDKSFAAAGGVGSPGDDPQTLEMKRRLANNTAKMKDSGKMLKEAEGVLATIHETADATIDELDRQKKTVQSISGTTSEIDSELTQTQRILRKMQRELMKNKLMLAGVIAILVIAIIGLLYYKFGGSGGDSATGSNSGAADDATPSPGATPSPLTIPPLTSALRRRLQ